MSSRDYFFVQLTIVVILITMITCKAIILRPEWFGEAPMEAVTAQRVLPNSHQ